MEKTCPMLNKPCIEHGCRWYTQLLGKHPQTGEQLNKFGCAVEFLPVLLIETAKETRQAAAAVESARNEARKDAAAIGAGLLQVAEAAREGAAGFGPCAGSHRMIDGANAHTHMGKRITRGLIGRLRLAFKGD